MALDQMSDFLHRLFRSAVSCPPEPAFPERLDLIQGRCMPENPKFLLHVLGPAHLQIQGPKSPKAPSLGGRKDFLRVQSEVLGAFQLSNLSLPELLLPNGVNRLAP